MRLAPPRGGMVFGVGRCVGQTARSRETLGRLAMIDEGLVADRAVLGLGLARASALDLPVVIAHREL